jgi:hypothetical protein
MNAATVEIRLTVPEKFHQVIKHIADLQDETVEQTVLRYLIVGLDCDLGQSAGEQMWPLVTEGDYQDQLKELAGVPS